LEIKTNSKTEVFTMAKVHSLAAFAKYGNEQINHGSMKTAFKSDLKKAIAHAGYPSKSEIDIVDTIDDFDMSATLSEVPNLIGQYMKDEDRAFNIPAVDDKTAPASLRIEEIPEKESSGIIQMGSRKGETYTSTVKAHNEIKIKSNRDAFKK
jgi:hypothetical protein